MKMITADLVVDETKRDTKGRRIAPKARREELLNEYEKSGLTQAAFARRAGVNYQTFVVWVRERRLRTSAPMETHAAAGRVQFTEVNLPASAPHEVSKRAGTLSVTLPDGLVVCGADASAVAALVKALRT